MTSGLEGHILAVNAGTAGKLQYGRRAIETALVKTPINGRVPVTSLGLPGDEHVYEDHGGPDMALLAYPHEHYAHWVRLGLDLPPTGAMGENLTVTGLVEPDVHVGDIFEVGSCMVQVSQPRAPCYKLSARYGRRDMPVIVQNTGYTGYLMRVLVEGDIGAGDTLRLVERQPHGVTVAEAGRVVNVDRNDVEAARRIVDLEALGGSVRRKLRQRIESNEFVGLDSERLFVHDPEEP